MKLNGLFPEAAWSVVEGEGCNGTLAFGREDLAVVYINSPVKNAHVASKDSTHTRQFKHRYVYLFSPRPSRPERQSQIGIHCHSGALPYKVSADLD